MHDTMKKCLFGGTLFAAGAVGQADAQITFESNVGGAYPTSFTTGYVSGYGSPGYILNQYVSYSPASSPVAPALATGYGYVAYGYVSAGYMNAFSYGYGSAPGPNAGLQPAVGQAYAYFSVATPVDVTISWDFTNEDGAGGAFFADIALTDWTAGGVSVFTVDPSGNPADISAGSVTISLVAGVNYSLLLEASTDNFNGGTWATATFVKVPTPASAAVLGLAGLAATRRRR